MANKIFTPWVMISLAVLSLGVLFAISSCLAPHWRTGHGIDEGLYYFCVDGECHRLENIPHGDEGWWKFIQITMPMTTASAGLALGFALMFMYQVYNKQKINQKLPDLCLGLAVTSGIVFVGLNQAYRMGVFRKHTGMDLGYCSHVLHAICPLLIIGASIFRGHAKCIARRISGEHGSNCGYSCNSNNKHYPPAQQTLPPPYPGTQPMAPPYGQPMAPPYGQPGTQYGQPGTQYGQPGTQYVPPSAQYDQPGTQYGQPGTQYGQPAYPMGNYGSNPATAPPY